MLYRIASDISGRLRLVLAVADLTEQEATGIEHYLTEVSGVLQAHVRAANGSVLVHLSPGATPRAAVLRAVEDLDVLALSTYTPAQADPEVALAHEDDRFHLEVANILTWSALRRLFLPAPVRAVMTVVRALHFIRAGIASLLAGHLTVEVLDATAILASVLRGTFGEADTIMTLLTLSDAMERHVSSRVRLSLERGLVERDECVWRIENGNDSQISLDKVREGDLLRLRAGSVVPVNGKVVAGVAALDEASMTGEARLVHKDVDSTVYAGTAIAEGELIVQVSAPPGAARIDAIAQMVERTCEAKANSQYKAEALADRLVPAAFAAFFGILIVTRDMTRALATLMVDYSCALRLSTPVAVMSAMREAAERGIIVKGGRYLEALAEADTAVFDKTGTLTCAKPHLHAVVSTSHLHEDEILRLAACIEEHFPHSVARAIVDAAAERNLSHEVELHARVRYVVAHGIAAEVEDKHAVIGSAHFVFEDEGVEEPAYFEDRLDEAAPGCGRVYLASDGTLLGALAVEDPLRDDVANVLDALRAQGVARIVMLTGDSERAASATAAAAGIDTYLAQVLPEDKASYISALEEAGHRTIMVGDGINDSPALAAASVSVALADASDIARTVADISIRSDDLTQIVHARTLASRLQRRINGRYRLIVGLNSALIALGVAGLIPLTTAATLHNLSTIAIVTSNTRPLLDPVRTP